MKISRATTFWTALALLVGTPLGGCGSSDTASYIVEGPAGHSLTLIREKRYYWSKGWDLTLIVAGQPDCQRRHRLRPARDGRFRLSVFKSDGQAYILQQGKHWYVTELKECRLQEYDQPPPDPGRVVGTFEAQGGPLHFSRETNVGRDAKVHSGAPDHGDSTSR